jgi:DNA-3-methyladenine glycosylase
VAIETNQPGGKLLTRAFFEAPPERVARRLLGKVLARRSRAGWLTGRIVEVEAYLGPHRQPADPAAHAHRGPTPRNQVLFGPAGHAYVYSIYGLYYCMNVSCEREGRAGGVLIRALEPVAGLEQMARNRGLRGFPPFSQKTREGWGTGRGPGCEPGRELTSGPGRLCQALGITRSGDNGLDLLDPKSSLQLRDDGAPTGRVLVTARIGIRHAVELPLRFALAGNDCVSGPKSMGRSRISSIA